MKSGCCGLGIFGIIFGLIGKVIEVIVLTCVYLGLYYPIFYLTVVFCLWIWGGMTFVPSVELTLFYVGLALSIICSIIVTLRHIIFEPLGRFIDRHEEEKANKPRKKPKKHTKDDGNRGEDELRYRPARRPSTHERPYVYRSEQNRSLIIYEFSDRFEVYREGERGLRYLDTKWKRR